MPNVKKLIRRKAQRYGVDPGILTAQIRAESGFNKNARSPAGAQGIAQFIPSTAKQYGVNLHDNRIADDIDGAARYMRDNLKRSGGNYHEALSIYNSGRPDGYKHIPETRAYVAKILSESGGKHKAAPNTRQGAGSSSSETTTTSYRSTPGTDYSTERRDAKLAYLQDSHNPDALLNLGLTLKGLKDTPGTSSKVVKRTGSSSGSVSSPVKRTGSALVDAVKAEADQIDKAQVSYQWGGGHGAKQARGSKITPLDCSGAVSRVLGVDPRVSGEFAKWGKPGRGKVTVYSNSHHVLMEINGHFFGTSSTNPGGGPGWIPRSALPKGYLKNFVARHA